MDRIFRLQALAASTLLALGFTVTANAQTTPTTPSTGTSAAGSHPTTPDANVKSAPTTPSKPRANGSSLAHGDVKFMEEAAAGGIAEVELGNLAQKQAHSPEVKDFAARMVKDHSKANDELKPLAAAKNVALPSGPDKKHQKEMDKLAKKSGADFDKAYMDHMVKDHKKDVKEFQKQAKSAKDDDLRKFAANTLPTLEEHLRLAEQADDAVKGKKAK